MGDVDSRKRQNVIAMTVIFGVIAVFMWYSGPRLINDFRHAGDFVPAESYQLTNYHCTNWNGGIVSECTATFTAPDNRASQEITDWRFGRAPQGRVQLMQRRADAAAVTTNVSLETLGNRMALALTLVLFGGGLAIALAVKSLNAADAPLGAPRLDRG